MRRIELRLVALQRQYEETAERLAATQRLLKALGLPRASQQSPLTWAAVCRARGWPSDGDAHRTVKRADPRLHALLHQSFLGQRCALDKATYAP
jgi:hypothetical protein